MIFFVLFISCQLFFIPAFRVYLALFLLFYLFTIYSSLFFLYTFSVFFTLPSFLNCLISLSSHFVFCHFLLLSFSYFTSCLTVIIFLPPNPNVIHSSSFPLSLLLPLPPSLSTLLFFSFPGRITLPLFSRHLTWLPQLRHFRFYCVLLALLRKAVSLNRLPSFILSFLHSSHSFKCPSFPPCVSSPSFNSSQFNPLPIYRHTFPTFSLFFLRLFFPVNFSKVPLGLTPWIFVNLCYLLFLCLFLSFLLYVMFP